MELAAKGDWLERMRGEMDAWRDPDAVRRMPFCSAYVLFTDLTYLYEPAVNADRAILGLPPITLEDFRRGTTDRPAAGTDQ